MTMLFLHVSPLPWPIKALTHCLSWVEVGLWTNVPEQLVLPSKLLASEIKQTFLSTNLACLLALGQQAARPHSFR